MAIYSWFSMIFPLKWWFSIVMLVYQRVCFENQPWSMQKWVGSTWTPSVIQVVGETGSMFCLDAPEDEVGMSSKFGAWTSDDSRTPSRWMQLDMGLSRDCGQKKTLWQVSMEKMMINHEIWGHQIITRANMLPPNWIYEMKPMQSISIHSSRV
jgi:hypothetical protein